MKSILVLTDFSRQANYVAEFAIHIATVNKSGLIFCHVIENADFISTVKSKRTPQSKGYKHTLISARDLRLSMKLLEKIVNRVHFNQKYTALQSLALFQTQRKRSS